MPLLTVVFLLLRLLSADYSVLHFFFSLCSVLLYSSSLLLRLLHSTLFYISSSPFALFYSVLHFFFLFRFRSVPHFLSECVKMRSVITASDRNTTVLRPLSTAMSVNLNLNAKSV